MRPTTIESVRLPLSRNQRYHEPETWLPESPIRRHFCVARLSVM